MTQAAIVHPVILSGGAGTRLWPLSRSLRPKQLLPLASDYTMLQETVRRVHGPAFAPPLIVCNDEHRFMIDLATVIESDARVAIVTAKDADALDLLRHDAAHVMAQAVQELYPGTQVTIGPSIENGFYYDFARAEAFTPDDLGKIEARMREIVDRDLPIDHHLAVSRPRTGRLRCQFGGRVRDNHGPVAPFQNGWNDKARCLAGAGRGDCENVPLAMLEDVVSFQSAEEQAAGFEHPGAPQMVYLGPFCFSEQVLAAGEA